MKITTSKWNGLEAVSIKTQSSEMHVITEFGPRIAHFSALGGENLFFWDKNNLGHEDWKLRGGHRIWWGRPLADEAAETYFPDNQKVVVEIKTNSVRFTAALDPVLKVKRGFEIKVLSESQFEIEHFLTNENSMLFSGFLWALTCTLPAKDTKYLIPLGDDSSFNTFQMVFFKEWAGHGQKSFADEQFKILDSVLELTPKGLENKRMIQSHLGILAMVDSKRELIFAKRAPLQPHGQHPMGTNLALYVGPENFMVEMESMGLESVVKPGHTITWQETWVLAPLRKLETLKDFTKLFI